jgi:hypothetical protein
MVGRQGWNGNLLLKYPEQFYGCADVKVKKPAKPGKQIRGDKGKGGALWRSLFHYIRLRLSLISIINDAHYVFDTALELFC